TGASRQNRFATIEAEPLEANSPTSKNLAWGVVQQGANPNGVNVRGVATVDVLVDVNNRFAKDVADAVNHSLLLGKLDVAYMTVWEKRCQGAIPQPHGIQGGAPSNFHFVVVNQRLEPMERFLAWVVSHVKQVQMDV
ncbi:unnamed protein product, partial [marine sediment metagenome]